VPEFRLQRAHGNRGWLFALPIGAVLLLRLVGAATGVGPWEAPHESTEIPSAALDVSTTPLGVPFPAPSGSGGYSFLRTRDDGVTPVTWDRCQPVHYVMRPDGAPPQAAHEVRVALAMVSRATGLVFVDDGMTDEAPTEDRPSYQPERYGDRWAPVLLAWSRETETPRLAGGVLGFGGPQLWDPGSGPRYVTGMVVFDIDDVRRLGGFERGTHVRPILLHELGHLVGLAHVTDRGQVMWHEDEMPYGAYMAGDLRGLERLGSGPCHTDH
jgi:hypothetical protein